MLNFVRLSSSYNHHKRVTAKQKVKNFKISTQKGGKMAAKERRARVLEAIVRDYVTTREPVGSKTLVERYNLGVSPATVRNDMAILEAAGYITQPHTSAGRIPTDAGYRAYVDTLPELTPLKRAEKLAIQRFLAESLDLDDALARAGRLLSQLTHQVAVIQYPSLEKVRLRHMDVISLAPGRALLVLITSVGRVEQRLLRVFPEVCFDDIEDMLREINMRGAGEPLREVALVIADIARRHTVERHDNIDAGTQERRAPDVAHIASQIATAVEDCVKDDAEERITLTGTANLSRHAVDFAHSIAPVLDALEEQVVILRLLSDMHSRTAVTIGSENEHENLSEASVISTVYSDSGHGVARIGIVGPTRMDYAANIAATQAVSNYLSGLLSST
ncbi:heat-inducible transcriptional repressor HrcA [Actinotignum urinale]|uniref:Heat-inducible transcription repressor HrcA n=1 Tax=Actinotignum urinale TaxID=190146 RepID=A0AAW9HXQ3_9ACTO|nr:heat-inducible transcriptional repressor HrcA [Actinotignum urinale]MDY5152086.1 heat-inducible transcriptional repressor HrcA [Actinotignum urinale]MDY5154601.1 heat-inducible transcriptional repressor HrcA [Actinotignum urinale]